MIMLFPAYAGVILNAVRPQTIFLTFPRIRGGDPRLHHRSLVFPVLFPAYAGVILGN